MVTALGKSETFMTPQGLICSRFFCYWQEKYRDVCALLGDPTQAILSNPSSTLSVADIHIHDSLRIPCKALDSLYCRCLLKKLRVHFVGVALKSIVLLP